MATPAHCRRSVSLVPTPHSQNLPAMLMHVADPESGMSDEDREIALHMLLDKLQDEPVLAEHWEIIRHVHEIPDDRTLQDWTVLDIEHMARNFYEAVQRGEIPDPRDAAFVVMLSHDVPDEDVAVFNMLAATVTDRLVASGFLYKDDQGHIAALPDFFVMAHGIAANAANTLETMDEHDYAVMLEAQRVFMNLFLWQQQKNRDHRKMN